MKEIPVYECWRAVGMIPCDAGTTCLRALVKELNEVERFNQAGHETPYPYPDDTLRNYAMRYKAGSAKSIRCDVGRFEDGCEAEIEMSPELYELLSEHS